VAAVEARDGQQVHDGEVDGDHGLKAEEHIPPHTGRLVGRFADADKAAHIVDAALAGDKVTQEAENSA